MDIICKMIDLVVPPPKRNRRGPQIGTIIEIKTSKGLAYAQYSHDGEGDNYLGFEIMRQIAGFYPTRPSNFDDVISEATVYHFYFFLKHALKDKVFEVIGVFPVPKKDQIMPRFRSGMPDPCNDNRITGGWITQGGRTTRVHVFTEEQHKMSMGGVWGYPLLAESLEIGWRPELDPSVVGLSNYSLNELRSSYLRKVGRSEDDRHVTKKDMTHYFLFKSESSANKICDELKMLGLTVEAPKSADGKQWLAVARQKTGQSFDLAGSDAKMLALAKKHGGIYDGSESYTGS
jgi:Regulator of ribonuclease activity B